MMRVIRPAVCALVLLLCTVHGWASAQPTPTDVCVTMIGSTGQVGGLQLDLHWDPACMTAERTGNNAVQCASNPGTGKNVQTSLFADGATMRALFFSITNTRPIPDDSELFCCKFTLANRSRPCCAASIGNVILANVNTSDPKKTRIYDPSISLQLLVNNVPCTDSGASGAPSNPVRPPAPSSAGGPAPVIVPPGGEAGGSAPRSGSGAAGSRPPAGVGAPAIGGAESGTEAGALSAEEAAPTVATGQPTAAAATPRTTTPLTTGPRTTTPQRTLAPTPAATRKLEGTTTAAAVGSPTPPRSGTQTPAAKKRQKNSAQQQP